MAVDIHDCVFRHHAGLYHVGALYADLLDCQAACKHTLNITLSHLGALPNFHISLKCEHFPLWYGILLSYKVIEFLAWLGIVSKCTFKMLVIEPETCHMPSEHINTAPQAHKLF